MHFHSQLVTSCYVCLKYTLSIISHSFATQQGKLPSKSRNSENTSCTPEVHMLTVSLLTQAQRENSHPDKQNTENTSCMPKVHTLTNTQRTQAQRENSHQNRTLHREYIMYAQSTHSKNQQVTACQHYTGKAEHTLRA